MYANNPLLVGNTSYHLYNSTSKPASTSVTYIGRKILQLHEHQHVGLKGTKDENSKSPYKLIIEFLLISVSVYSMEPDLIQRKHAFKRFRMNH